MDQVGKSKTWWSELFMLTRLSATADVFISKEAATQGTVSLLVYLKNNFSGGAGLCNMSYQTSST